MRNPMFASYQFTPGVFGDVDPYEDILDRFKREYKIDYGLGPSYDERKFKKNWLNFWGE